jgi:hypothetical protein
MSQQLMPNTLGLSQTQLGYPYGCWPLGTYVTVPPPSRSLVLRSGGTLTLSVSADVMRITDEDLAFIRALLGAMSRYERPQDAEPVG